MSLKEITADLHDLAEDTPFMKAVFEKRLPLEVWKEWTSRRSVSKLFRFISDKFYSHTFEPVQLTEKA